MFEEVDFRECYFCGDEYTIPSGYGKYCSDYCRSEDYCEPEFEDIPQSAYATCRVCKVDYDSESDEAVTIMFNGCCSKC